MIPSRLVAATGNAHKVDELCALFEQHGVHVDIVPITSVVDSFDVDETGSTFEENAYIKAAAGYNQCLLPVLADDSGLEVDALDGAPGVYSARYSGANATDASNRTKLLHELGTTAQRDARFRCVLALYDGMRTVLAEGSCEGTIAREERGANGFGYDALFLPRGIDNTFGEVDSHVKHQRSHRAAAVAHLIAQLQNGPTVAITTTSRSLLGVAIACATGNDELLRRSVVTMDTIDDYRRMYEVILQSYLFCGFPSALDGLVILDTIAREHGFSTLAVHHEVYNVNTFQERGEALCRRVYGGVYDRMMDRLQLVSPEMSEWMIVEGYGKTLARPALDLVDRECCIVAVLACTGRRTQLVSHVRGALAVGATVDYVHAIIDALRECGMASAALLLDDVLCRFQR